MSFKDHFSGDAADYRRVPAHLPAGTVHVPSLPFAAPRTRCGIVAPAVGPAAVALAGYFARVFATDASAERVKNARPPPLWNTAVAPAESVPSARRVRPIW